jgi:hypothetical protein
MVHPGDDENEHSLRLGRYNWCALALNSSSARASGLFPLIWPPKLLIRLLPLPPPGKSSRKIQQKIPRIHTIPEASKQAARPRALKEVELGHSV